MIDYYIYKNVENKFIKWLLIYCLSAPYLGLMFMVGFPNMFSKDISMIAFLIILLLIIVEFLVISGGHNEKDIL